MTDERPGTTLDIVIVNWNGGALIEQCVDALAQAAEPDPFFQVIVVDNASTDGSADRIARRRFPVTLIRNRENRGFAAACNQGARLGSAPYVLLLNPDTVVTREALARAIEFMRSAAAARVGVCGIQLRDEAGRVTRSCARFPSAGRQVAAMLGLDRAFPSAFPPHFMTEWDHQSPRRVDQVMGAFFLVRRSVYDELGGLDERFFVYYEEVDFCRRALDRGWATYFLSEPHVLHVGCGTTDAVRATRLFFSLRSRVLYGYKHFSRAGAAVHALASTTLEPLARVARAAAAGDRATARETLEGARMLWRDLPTVRAVARTFGRG